MAEKKMLRLYTQRVPQHIAAEKDHRKELWIAVAVAVAGAPNCTDSTAPAAWANKALRAFDATFSGDA